MARIVGVDIPNEKRVVVSLTYIYGIGDTTAKKICKDAKVSEDIRVKDLTDDQGNVISWSSAGALGFKGAKVSEDIRVKDLTDEQLAALRNEIAKYHVEGDLRREVALNIKRLGEIGCYRGVRHRHGLPVRGQRTRTNARTRKGKRKTIANKKVASQG